MNIGIDIDDTIPNCKQIHENGTNAILMDSMENKEEELQGVPRVYSWIHAEQEINKILNKMEESK